MHELRSPSEVDKGRSARLNRHGQARAYHPRLDLSATTQCVTSSTGSVYRCDYIEILKVGGN